MQNCWINFILIYVDFLCQAQFPKFHIFMFRLLFLSGSINSVYSSILWNWTKRLNKSSHLTVFLIDSRNWSCKVVKSCYLALYISVYKNGNFMLVWGNLLLYYFTEYYDKYCKFLILLQVPHMLKMVLPNLNRWKVLQAFGQCVVCSS